MRDLKSSSYTKSRGRLQGRRRQRTRENVVWLCSLERARCVSLNLGCQCIAFPFLGGYSLCIAIVIAYINHCQIFLFWVVFCRCLALGRICLGCRRWQTTPTRKMFLMLCCSMIWWVGGQEISSSFLMCIIPNPRSTLSNNVVSLLLLG